MSRHQFKRMDSKKYNAIVNRFVRQMEKEVTELGIDYRELSVQQVWDIVTDAYRYADRIATGGYSLR